MNPLLAPMTGTERRDVGGAQVDVVRTGTAGVRRLIYPPGFERETVATLGLRGRHEHDA